MVVAEALPHYKEFARAPLTIFVVHWYISVDWQTASFGRRFGGIMNIHRTLIVALTLSFIAVPGCDEDPRVSEGLLTAEEAAELAEREEVTFRKIHDNGEVLNGRELNGKRLNGKRLNGKRLNGKRLNGVNLLGTLLQSFHRNTNDSQVVAYNPVTEENVEGAGLEDAEFEIDTDENDSVDQADERIRITNVTQSVSQTDVYFNMVEYFKTPDNVWESMCEDGAGNPVEAIALTSVWDPDTGADLDDPDGFTWACRGAALAKCVEWGYRRWGTHNSTSLKNYHKACTRMVRGDYCGDGTVHTVNGTPIDIADDIGVNTHDTVAGQDGWAIEAKWGVNGAVCLNNPRKVTWDHNDVGCSIPYCNSDQNDFEGGLLMTVTQQTN